MPNKLNLKTQRRISGAFRGSQIKKVWGGCQTAGPIGTKFGTRLRIRLGMDIGQIQFAPRYLGRGGGVRGYKFKSQGKI